MAFLMGQGEANFNGVPQFASDHFLRIFADTVRIKCQRQYDIWLENNPHLLNQTPALWVLTWAEHAYPGQERKLIALRRQHDEQIALVPLYEADLEDRQSNELLDHHWTGFEEELAQVQEQLHIQIAWVNFIDRIIQDRHFKHQLQVWVDRVTNHH